MPRRRLRRGIVQRHVLECILLGHDDALAMVLRMCRIQLSHLFAHICAAGITGELDRSKGHWFGLIKTMRDPTWDPIPSSEFQQDEL
jgi:hypothetical protein